MISMSVFRAPWIGAAILVACCALPAQELQTIRLTCLPGVPLAVVIGQKNGIFAKYGIAVEAQRAKDAVSLRSDLASGNFDVADGAVENAVVMADAGADVVIVMGGESSTSELIVQPEIKSVGDLRGKTVIADGLDTAYALTTKKILRLNKLEAGADYKLEVVGLAPQRLEAMRANKEYAATIQKPPTSILSERAGLKSLGSTQELLGWTSSQGIGGFVEHGWAKEHADLLERYIAAFIEAQRWLMSPENKPQVVELLMKESHLPADIAGETYDVDVRSAWSKDARFEVEGFRNGLKLQAEFQPPASGKDLPPEKYYDLSFYERAAKRTKAQ
jgi:ABC-type nitrate/sulfonate/bicarbonate transport system substrate-binding protein